MSKHGLKAATMMMAMMMAASVAGAAKPGATQPSCLQAAFSYQLDEARGVAIVKVDLRNACFPGTDIEGEGRLMVDGAIVDRAALGLDDQAQLFAEIPLDGAPHEACVRFEGTSKTEVRRKVQIAPVTLEQCQAQERLAEP